MFYACELQYLSAWNNYKFAIDHIVLMPKYRMKAQEIAKTEGLLDNKKKKDRTKTKVPYMFVFALHIWAICIASVLSVQSCYADAISISSKCYTDLHRRTSPICVNQWHRLAADRDCDLLLAATSSSAQLSRTLVPGHLPLQDPKCGISFQQTFVQLTQSTSLKAL